MGYGVSHDVRVPCCGEVTLYYVDYRTAPPPIPPPRGGTYADYNTWFDDEGQPCSCCPKCDEELPIDPSVALKAVSK